MKAQTMWEFKQGSPCPYQGLSSVGLNVKDQHEPIYFTVRPVDGARFDERLMISMGPKEARELATQLNHYASRVESNMNLEGF